MKIKHANGETEELNEPVDIINAINAGGKIVDAAMPVIKKAIEAITEWIDNMGNSISTPRGKRLRIEANDALDVLQSKKDELHDSLIADLTARVEKLEMSAGVTTFP